MLLHRGRNRSFREKLSKKIEWELNWATSLLATQGRVSQQDYFILFGRLESLTVKIIYYVQGILQNSISDQTFQNVNKSISEKS